MIRRFIKSLAAVTFYIIVPAMLITAGLNCVSLHDNFLYFILSLFLFLAAFMAPLVYDLFYEDK